LGQRAVKSNKVFRGGAYVKGSRESNSTREQKKTGKHWAQKGYFGNLRNPAPKPLGGGDNDTEGHKPKTMKEESKKRWKVKKASLGNYGIPNGFGLRKPGRENFPAL